MTPERKKYLKSCSKEELAIRKAIDSQRGTIGIFKELLSFDAAEPATTGSRRIQAKRKQRIAECKAVIKALRKQLPCKVGKVTVFTMSDNSEGWTVRICESCGDWVMLGEAPVEEQPTHCPWCGKQLRWTE